MQSQLFQIVQQQAVITPDNLALTHKQTDFSYRQLQERIAAVGSALANCGLKRGDRVGIYLPKLPETVFSIFGTSYAGGVFVPINPLLKPAQVEHILNDCNVRVLITSADRANLLADTLTRCRDLNTLVTLPAGKAEPPLLPHLESLTWTQFLATAKDLSPANRIDTDVAAILYTSGSTGKPKGVVLSHRNMICGAHSVASYLQNTADDRLLAVLPFSFDYGLSQITTAFSVGASVVLMDYLLPRDVIKAVERYGITGLAAVPPLWNQLANLEWPDAARRTLRYITNSGGAMPKATTARLRESLPRTKVYLMYGLTEAFRSTYLPPEELGKRPDSMGKAIPNAEVMVVREDGTECAPHEPGELVHRGSLVSLGYWNDPIKTAERFKPAPGQNSELPLTEIAVWSGDQVYRDEDGFLYFVSRKDEMIKTSGYRVSPTELEETLYQSRLVDEVAAIGVPHTDLGQAIVIIAKSSNASAEDISQHCRRELPNYMQPQHIEIVDEFLKNPNGKLDRNALKQQYQNIFVEVSS